MKKLVSLTILVITLAVIFLSSTALANGEGFVFEAPISSRIPQAALDLLPDDTEIPNRLPSKIQDPVLLAAWILLYNQVDQIEINDGLTLTGHELAEYALVEKVPVEWGSQEICRGNSCSVRFICADLACVEQFKNRKMYTIFIDSDKQTATPEGLLELAGSLAHELYHHRLPFGPVYTSLYEEFWAYKIGGTISQAGWATFEGYDPEDTDSLQAWFIDHKWQGFTDRDVYPLTFSGVVK